MQKGVSQGKQGTTVRVHEKMKYASAMDAAEERLWGNEKRGKKDAGGEVGSLSLQA